MSDVQADRLERMNRFVNRMNEVERDLTAPYVRPKDAATLILVDRSGPVPKVLLGKRHELKLARFVWIIKRRPVYKVHSTRFLNSFVKTLCAFLSRYVAIKSDGYFIVLSNLSKLSFTKLLTLCSAN